MQAEKLLVVDDESGIRNSLAGILGDEGWQVDLADSGEQALATLKERSYRAIFLDVWLPGIDGLETLRLMRRSGVETPVVIISGHGTIETAVRATKLGAFDFVEKPLSLEKVLLTLRNALRQKKLEDQSRALREQMRRDTDLAGESPAIGRLREEIDRAARLHAPVLITGENGTGKELVARMLHARGSRADESFIAINCSAVPANIIEVELFGEIPRGDVPVSGSGPAPTGHGTIANFRGKITLAHEGTLFLDEVAGLRSSVQAKLRETVDRGELTPVGASTPIPVDTRIIAATSQDLGREVAAGRFREDLYYSLNAIPLTVPPLRERREDIPVLVEHFVRRFCREYGRLPLEVPPETLALLSSYGWPGNVRELKNVVERVVIKAPGPTVRPEDLPAQPSSSAGSSSAGTDGSPEAKVITIPSRETSGEILIRTGDGELLRDARDRFESAFIRMRLLENGWNISRTAEKLGLERSNLYRKMKAYDLREDREV